MARQWRYFNFFEKEELIDPETGTIFDKLKDINVSVCTSGRGQVIVGDFSGLLHIVNRSLEVTSFRAYQLRVTHAQQMKSSNILVTVGEDKAGSAFLRVWNFDKLDKGNPACVRESHASPANKPSPVSCVMVHESLCHMALGFADGSVVHMRGDITRERHCKSKTIHETCDPVTGLGFKQYAKDTFLFIATLDKVYCYDIGVKDRIQKKVLDERGCSLRCSTLTEGFQEHQFALGQTEAVYFYTTDTVGPCRGFEGEKVSIHWFRSYLIVVNRVKPVGAAALRKQRVEGDGGTEEHSVTVYDMQNKFIAYSIPKMAAVLDVLYEWGSIFIVDANKSMYRLQEKDTQAKLDILFKKNLYTIAISLAESLQYDSDGLIDIFRQYGDHLYNKGDFDGAKDQYIKTIGKLEASYVIRKFLDSQRIHNLTEYLQALHTHNLATEDHTTLLLNCYTKLKEDKKLEEFINTKNKDVNFDVETAIRVLRQAGYSQHALSLAEQHGRHEWYLKIQLENIKDYHRALAYIDTLDFTEAEHNMKVYGKVLVHHAPRDATNLLKKLCTNYIPRGGTDMDGGGGERGGGERGGDSGGGDGGGGDSGDRASADEFIHIFVNSSGELQEFLEHMVQARSDCPSTVYNTLLELYLHDVMHEKDVKLHGGKSERIMALLTATDAKYDLDQALVLCEMCNFKAGILYLYEKSQLYPQILKYHMDHREHQQIIDTCTKFGRHDPKLWVQALWYFARCPDEQKTQLARVLTEIDKRKLLPPLLVVETLAQNSSVTLSVIKDYIKRQIQLENEKVEEDERMIRKYKEDTERIRERINDLENNAQIFQMSKCSACNNTLELPSVHFLCKHSFHQNCFESYCENESECFVCMNDNRKILDLIRAQETSTEMHGQFHEQLSTADDGFAVIAEYFGRGLFTKKWENALKSLTTTTR